LNDVVVFKEVLQEGLHAVLIIRPAKIKKEDSDFGVGGGQRVGLKGFDEGNGFKGFRHGQRPY
jgi:hypothetical protein